MTQEFETPLHLQWGYYQGPTETSVLKHCTLLLSENKCALLGAPCSHACIPADTDAQFWLSSSYGQELGLEEIPQKKV